MRVSRFRNGVVLACVLLVAGIATAGSARAQSDAELKALNQRVIELYQAGKYGEAIPLAERYAQVIEAHNGIEGPEYALALNNLAQLLRATNRLSEAEPLMRRALAIDEKSLGPEHPSVAIGLNNLAGLLQATNRMSEAEPLMRRALAIDEKSLGPEHPNVARDLSNLALLLRATNRLAEAEPLMRRALAIDEKSLGPEHPNVARDLSNLALLLRATNRLAEAEPLMRRALAIDEKSLGPEHPNVATRLNNLALLLRDANRLAEAEPLYRRALAIDEKSLGPEHPDAATAINNLAGLLRATNRLAEAESLMRRALAIGEKSFGPEHPDVAIRLNNLALLLRDANRLAEAEPLYRRALAIDEKSFGPEHPNVATGLNNLAGLLHDTNQLSEAEPLMRRALAIDEKSFGADHPNVARDLNNLALLLMDANRLDEAEPLMRRALAIDEKSFGPEHPKVAIRLENLAWLLAERGDWAEAAAMGRRAKPMLIARKTEAGDDRTGIAKAALARNTWALRANARAEHRANADNADAREEGFELAQWALQTGAADALAQMSVRFARGAGPLAGLVRERQDLIARRQGEMRRLDVAVGRADAKAAEELRAAVVALDKKLDGIDKSLTAEFPEYAELANPQTLTIAATQTLLKADEALILFLDVPQFGKLPGESIAWVVTKETARWRNIPLGTDALSDRVAALRCGLDASSWDDPSGWPQETALGQQRAREQHQRVREQKARRERCKQLLGLEVSADDWPPFDPVRSYELYQALLAPFAEATKDKNLFIVPSGALTSLPFHALVTEEPHPALTGTAPYRQAAWLALRQPVTVLPSVGSLRALRKLGPSQAAEPYIAFGNPLLLGPSGNDKRAWDKQRCLQQPAPTHVTGNKDGLRGGVVLRAIDLAELRTQRPLPEAADELCTVADVLGAMANETDTVWLGERATERNLKALSRESKLARYKVVHFATHGLLSGESAAILNAKAEPALILTPPKDGTTPAELEEDNGLLTASEVAQLELDAEWVVLSACNTAAGEGDAEALSGLARAFFYAKARALLVSHWSVSSHAAVKLTTRTFAELKSNPLIGRAEALRKAMVALIEKGEDHEAHPAYWAPFVVVGEGGAAGVASLQVGKPEAPIVVAPARTKATAAKPRSKKREPWAAEIWGKQAN